MKVHDKEFKTSQELSDAICWELAEYQTIITLALSNCSKEEVSKILKVVERGERFSSTTKEWLKQNIETFHKPKWDKEVKRNDRHAKSN
ncbi:hypothetical protein P4U08_28935 [Bacillus paranthracis]|uniref:hypothetical protein n=1 Tax=Bacillus paranthracis TaxID=2026186 RepID=UPI002E1A5F1B|nr:hypothetical protein [Bacillus paranthracis]MED3146534.1 hypothetical protein [Bacillus thuringiensis]MED3157483.1 hypothetical protein [Bacillus thuringiensis]